MRPISLVVADKMLFSPGFCGWCPLVIALRSGEQGIPGYVLAGVEEGFVRLARVKRFPFLGVATQPQVFILARSDLLKSSPCADTT